MGLGAFVYCRCFLDGVAADPPFATEVDAEGYISPVASLGGEKWAQWSAWERDACVHDEMRVADEGIANWSGYRVFQAALQSLGSDHFPTLMDELPEANGGRCVPERSALCLSELDRFEQLPLLESIIQLVDADTGNSVSERVDAYDGVFVLDGRTGQRLALSASATFQVLDAPTSQVLFEADHFEQQLVDPTAKHPQARLVSADGASVVVSVIRDHSSSLSDATTIPARFEVRRTTLATRDYEYVLAPLRSVFTASRDHQMPVMWC